MNMWEKLSNLAGTLPLHYTPDDLGALLDKTSDIFREYGDDDMADFYIKYRNKMIAQAFSTLSLEDKD